MAAEYSRELSAKVHAGHVRLVGLGFRTGGPIAYGLQRLAVDEEARPKGILAYCRFGQPHRGADFT